MKSFKRSKSKSRFNNETSNKNHGNKLKCKYYGDSTHENCQSCPVKNIYCHKCGKTGHFAKVCLSGNNNNSSSNKKNVASLFLGQLISNVKP